MNLLHFLEFIGGLGLFLFGMHYMGEMLEHGSSDKLKSILRKLTNNPVKGVLLGALVTGIIQSSSATTVMMVGFVNAGLMQLSQAISVIMGANIGTTITGWFLSLGGIKGDNIFVQMLKPDHFTPILAAIGVILVLFSKNAKRKNIGSIFMGFTILMFGMATMTSAMSPLAHNDKFIEILTYFQNPIFGILAGFIVTGVIQSSSASVGILQALSLSVPLPFSSAMAIILGQNIGTCVTALLSSIGTSKNAKRVAIVHLYFNLFGSVLFMILFYSLNSILKFSFYNMQVEPYHIALMHSIFNIFTTVVFLPFTKVLQKLAKLTIKDDSIDFKKADKDFVLLDTKWLAYPSLAVSQCKKTNDNMALLVKENVSDAMLLFNDYSEELIDKISKTEERIDQYEDEIGTFLVQITKQELAEKDSHLSSIMLHAIGNFERMSDHALNLTKNAVELNNKKIFFSKAAQRELEVAKNAVEQIVNMTVESFADYNLETARKIEPLEQVIDGLIATIKTRHIKRLRNGTCTIELGFIFLDILNNLERISDHCSNIAIAVIQINSDNYDTHESLYKIKHSENENFIDTYNQFKIDYAI
ncbi:MAG: Na/Pi cotransporter family protein [Clostridia bacterium]|nr:Na/Pi cotransporter family protein [Clostridia bacterium]